MPVEHHSLTTPSLSHSSAESMQVDCLPMHLCRAKNNSAPLECRDSKASHYEGVSLSVASPSQIQSMLNMRACTDPMFPE